MTVTPFSKILRNAGPTQSRRRAWGPLPGRSHMPAPPQLIWLQRFLLPRHWRPLCSVPSSSLPLNALRGLCASTFTFTVSSVRPFLLLTRFLPRRVGNTERVTL